MDVAIVTYNSFNDVRDCVKSVIAASPDLVFVADNGSSDGSVEMLLDEFPDVTTVVLPDDPGYGAGINALVELSEAEYILALNADTRLNSESLAALQRHLDEHPDAAAVGPRLIGDDGVLQRSCFPELSLRERAWAEFRLQRFRPNRSGRALHAFTYDEPITVPWVLGAAIALRRSAFVGVGGFDPGFHLYYEETDLCRRLRDAGWEVHFTPATEVVHVGGTSIGSWRGAGHRNLYRSLHRYHRLHGTASIAGLRVLVASVMLPRLIRDRTVAMFARTSAKRRAARQSAAAWRGVLTDVARGWHGPPEPDQDVSEHERCLRLLPPMRPGGRVVALGAVDQRERTELVSRFGTVQFTLDPGDEADVLIVRSESDVDLGGALDSVAAGGIVAIERARGAGPAFTRAQSVRRILGASGFDVCSQYWMPPSSWLTRPIVSVERSDPLPRSREARLATPDSAGRLAKIVGSSASTAGLLAWSHVTVATKRAS